MCFPERTLTDTWRYQKMGLGAGRTFENFCMFAFLFQATFIKGSD